MSQKNEFDLAKIDPTKLPELQGWREKQLEAVKENPFVEITDNETYEIAKKSRTTLVTCRTTLEKQDKLVASKLKELRTKVGDLTKELIDITLPHENKQQEEVKRYEAEKEAERERKREEERQRIQKIKGQIENFKAEIGRMGIQMVFSSIDETINTGEKLAEEYKKDFDFQEFEPMFEETCADAMSSLNEKAVELREKEAQRLENERLAREAKLMADRISMLNPYSGYGDCGFEVPALATMPQKEFDALLSGKKKAYEEAKRAEVAKQLHEERRALLLGVWDFVPTEHRDDDFSKLTEYEFNERYEYSKSLKEKKEEEEKARQQKIQEEEERLAREKAEIQSQKETENKVLQRTKRLSEELGLKFNFVDAFVGENSEYVPMVDIKTASDEKFDEMVQSIKDFQNAPKKPENINEIEVDEVEEVEFEDAENNLPAENSLPPESPTEIPTHTGIVNRLRELALHIDKYYFEMEVEKIDDIEKLLLQMEITIKTIYK